MNEAEKRQAAEKLAALAVMLNETLAEIGPASLVDAFFRRETPIITDAQWTVAHATLETAAIQKLFVMAVATAVRHGHLAKATPETLVDYLGSALHGGLLGAAMIAAFMDIDEEQADKFLLIREKVLMEHEKDE